MGSGVRSTGKRRESGARQDGKQAGACRKMNGEM